MSATIERSSEIFSSIDPVWELISNTDKDEEYWGAIKDIRVVNREGNTIEREATVGPRGHKTRQTIVLDPKKSILTTIVGEGITGERRIVLVPMGKSRTRVDVSGKLEVTGVPGFVQGLLTRQISKSTEEALKRFKKEAESSPALSDKGQYRLMKK